MPSPKPLLKEDGNGGAKGRAGPTTVRTVNRDDPYRPALNNHQQLGDAYKGLRSGEVHVAGRLPAICGKALNVCFSRDEIHFAIDVKRCNFASWPA